MLLSIKIFLKIYNNILSWIFVPFMRENQRSDERIKIFPMVINAGNKRFFAYYMEENSLNLQKTEKCQK